jgi:hypothetical protein
MERYVEDHVEYLSLHFGNCCNNYTFLRNVLEYLDTKPVTQRRLGAFSFVVRRLPLADFYNINRQPHHFVARNRKYGLAYFAFGGSPSDRAYGLQSGPVLRQIVSGITVSSPTYFSVQVIEEYGAAAPYYDLPLPYGEDFDLPEVEANHAAYVSAMVGVRMSKDTTGRITEKRLSEIVAYVESIRHRLPWVASQIPVFYEFIRTSYVTSCDLDVLEVILSLHAEDYYQQLLNIVQTYGDHFRLFVLADRMFCQVMALPYSSEVNYNADYRQTYVDELLDNPNAPEERAIRTNQERIDQQLEDYHRETGKELTNIIYWGNKDGLLALSPIDLVLSLVDDTLTILSVNEPAGSDAWAEARRQYLFYPTDEVEILIDSVVNPECSLFSCNKHEMSWWIPGRDIFYTLNSNMGYHEHPN